MTLPEVPAEAITAALDEGIVGCCDHRECGWDHDNRADVAALLVAALPHLRTAILHAEVNWLRTAHANSADKGYSSDYRAGFAAAAGWIDFHADPVAWAKLNRAKV